MTKQTLSTLLASVFLCLSMKGQHDDSTSNSSLFKFKVAELESQYNPFKNHLIGSANYLLEIGKKRPFLKNYFFGEYNFAEHEMDFTFSIDPKLYGPIYLGLAFENDLFGIEAEKHHFQTGLKMYAEDFEPFSRWFTIASFGVNYSLLGTAEHRLHNPEIAFNLLTNPIEITPNLAFVIQSMGRIRGGKDFYLLQLGFEPRKIHHSVFVIGTGQVHLGEKEFFMGIQYAFIENHRKFRL